MSSGAEFHVRTPESAQGSRGVERLNELDRVKLGESVETNDGLLPCGSQGTIVLVWRTGEGFEVEFVKPFPTVVALKSHQVELLSRTQSL